MNTLLLKILAVTEKIPVGSGKTQVDIPKASSVDVLAGVLNTTYAIAGTFAVLVIILAGFSFMTGSYDPTKIAKAKNAILFAVVGLIIIISAFILTKFILDKL